MSQFVEVNTSDLTGLALDWAVAKTQDRVWPVVIGGRVYHDTDWEHTPYSPSTNWAQGGELLEKHKPWLSPPVTDPDPYPEQPYGWDAEVYDEEDCDVIGHVIGCQSALIAICRAIVAAKLGDVVQVPAELVGVVS